MSTEWLDFFSNCVQGGSIGLLGFSSLPNIIGNMYEDWGPPFLFEIIWLHEKDFSLCQRLVGLKEKLVDGWVFSWLIN